MGNLLSAKPASEIDVLRAVEIKAIAMGSRLTSAHELLILCSAAIKAENARTGTPGPIKRVEVACLLFKMLGLFGSEDLRALFSSPARLEPFVEVCFQLNRLGADVFALQSAVEAAEKRASDAGIGPQP